MASSGARPRQAPALRTNRNTIINMTHFLPNMASLSIFPVSLKYIPAILEQLKKNMQPKKKERHGLRGRPEQTVYVNENQ
jgi:hypothetical protein